MTKFASKKLFEELFCGVSRGWCSCILDYTTSFQVVDYRKQNINLSCLLWNFRKITPFNMFGLFFFVSRLKKIMDEKNCKGRQVKLSSLTRCQTFLPPKLLNYHYHISTHGILPVSRRTCYLYMSCLICQILEYLLLV